MSRGYFSRLPRNRIRTILVACLALLFLLLCFVIVWWFIIPPLSPSSSRPVSVPRGPISVNESQNFTFDGSGSTGQNLLYAWDFGDNTTSNEVSPSHSYDDGPNQFTVTLVVTDDQGRTDSASIQVKVENLPPVAEAGGPYSCQAGEIIQLAGECNDPGPSDNAILSCTWADFSGAALSQPTYICRSPGEMTVTLTATDKDGASNQDSATINISPGGVNPIRADANGPYTGTVGLPVLFDGSGSSPSDLIETYTWDSGNGQIGEGVITSVIYNEPGVYNVILTVTGNGQADSDTTTVTIIPQSDAQSPKAIIGPLALCAKNRFCYRFDGSLSSGASGNQIVNYKWDLGDGTIQQDVIVEHEYTTPDLYIITLIVTDSTGAKNSSSIAIRIP